MGVGHLPGGGDGPRLGGSPVCGRGSGSGPVEGLGIRQPRGGWAWRWGHGCTRAKSILANQTVPVLRPKHWDLLISAVKSAEPLPAQTQSQRIV